MMMINQLMIVLSMDQSDEYLFYITGTNELKPHFTSRHVE